MDIVAGIESFAPPSQGVVLAIGNFDGVHRGHRRIVQTARETARQSGTHTVVMTFEPHPLTIIAPQRAPARLTTAAEKLALLAACGIDATIVVRSEPALLRKSAQAFLEYVVEHCRPRAIVEGATFSFGRGRKGSVDTLRENAERLGYQARVLELLHCAELPDAPPINSSVIRRSLCEGRLEDANTMLGRPYRVTGTVGGGAGRGASIGFPTVNLEDVGQLLPQEAVYAAVAQLENGSFHLAAVNVGSQPTFAQSEPRVEAHLLDLAADLRGERVGLHLLAALRRQVKFDGVEALIEQLHRDVARTRELAPKLEQLESATRVPL